MDGNEPNISSNNLFMSKCGENFFQAQGNILSKDSIKEPMRRLNDYDYNLLREDAYKDVSDELLKLEYKISKIEDEYQSIDDQIQSARDISDYDTIEHLMSRKRLLKEDLEILSQIYNEKSISTKISGGIFNILSPKLREKVEKFNSQMRVFRDILISKLPGKIASVQEIKQSLNKLENINKSVDELMTLQTPYGESVDKYEQLSRYITRANAIQAKIARTLR